MGSWEVREPSLLTAVETQREDGHGTGPAPRPPGASTQRGAGLAKTTLGIYLYTDPGRCLSSLDIVCFPTTPPSYDLKTLIKLALGFRMKGLARAASRAPHQARDKPGS